MSCEYCEAEVNKRKFILQIETDYWDFNIYIDGNKNLTYDDMFESNKINFCPMCGRKL